MLAEQPGGLQRFLTKLQSLVEEGKSLSEIQHILDAATFWRGIKIAFKEIEGLLSITVSPGS